MLEQKSKYFLILFKAPFIFFYWLSNLRLELFLLLCSLNCYVIFWVLATSREEGGFFQDNIVIILGYLSPFP